MVQECAPSFEHIILNYSNMNLMDMLSQDPAQLQPAQSPELQLFAENACSTSPLDREFNNVFYLPTVMTKLQKDMSEAVVQIFRSGLEKEIRSRRLRASINSLLDNTEIFGNPDTLSLAERAQVVRLMLDQLKSICMHPSLVVDHFIPKKLLLLDIKERLLKMLGKLDLFNRIVDLISETYERPGAQGDFHLLVVAESIKELEWIEGLILGKKLYYRNLSTRKLFEEEEKPRFVKEESIDEENVEFKRRRRHFVARHTRRSSQPYFSLTLITTRQLYQNPLSGVQFDQIISFDAEIDLNSPSIELMRANNRASRVSMHVQVKTPVIIPTPIFSVEHLLRVLPGPGGLELKNSSDAQMTWQLLVLNVFVANRYKLFSDHHEDFFIENYGRNLSVLRDWLFNWDRVQLPSVFLLKYTNQLSFNWTDEKLESRLKENLLASLTRIFTQEAEASLTRILSQEAEAQHSQADISGVTDYETFKRKLAEFLSDRAAQVDTLIREGLLNILPKFRDEESKRQQEIDRDEELVGEEYRKLRKLNDDAIVVEKKFLRADTEYARVEATQKETQTMLEYLDETLKSKNEDELTTLIDEQSKLLQQLEEEKSKLDAEYTKVDEESEALRGKYQTKSTDAVEATSQLNAAKATYDQIFSKLNGPGMKLLPSLTKKDEQMTFDFQLSKVNKESAFIVQLFGLRLDKLIKERTAILESTSTGSSSRPSNRISRASTPFT